MALTEHKPDAVPAHRDGGADYATQQDSGQHAAQSMQRDAGTAIDAALETQSSTAMNAGTSSAPAAADGGQAGDAAAATGPQPKPVEPLHGFYRGEPLNGPAMQDAAAQWVGRDQQIAIAFQAHDTWDNISMPTWQLPPWSAWVAAKPGRKLVYGVALFPGGVDGSGPDGVLGNADDVSLQQCSDGQYNAKWTTLAKSLVSAGLSGTILRPGWEFDTDWPPWHADGKEALYAGCFRQLVTSMRKAEPNGKFEFDWNPSSAISGASVDQINAAWPGDAYVDLVGVDAYDTSFVADSYPYPASCDAACRATHQKNAWNDIAQGMHAMRDLAVAHNKPLSVPEWGVWVTADGHSGGDDPLYITNMASFLRDPANHVSFQAYFDWNDADGPHQISDVSGDSASGAVGHAYKTMFPDSAAKFKTLFAAGP